MSPAPEGSVKRTDLPIAQVEQAPDSFALGAALLALLLWSGTTSFNRIAVASIDSLTVGLLRSALAGMLALISVLAIGLKPPTEKRQVLLVLFSGMTSFAIWPALLSAGVSQTTAGHAGLVMALIPVMTVLFAQLLRRRVPGSKWWAGALLALGATTLLMLGRGMTLGPVDGGPGLLGDLVVFSGCAICAAGYVAGGRVSSSFGAMATTFWGLIAAMLVTVPVLVHLAPRTDWKAVPVSGWLAILYLTVFSSLIGYVLWFFALRRGGIRRVGSLQLAMPVMTVAVAGILLGERLSTSSSIAAALIIWGTYVAQRNA